MTAAVRWAGLKLTETQFDLLCTIYERPIQYSTQTWYGRRATFRILEEAGLITAGRDAWKITVEGRSCASDISWQRKQRREADNA